MCGTELMAWVHQQLIRILRAIKELQKKLDILNEAKPIEAAKAEFLEFSKMMVKTWG